MPRPRGQIDYIDRRDIIETLNDQFSVYDPTYRDTKAVVKGEIDDIADRILGIQRSGNPLLRSEQILAEVVWLHHYTADWNRLHRRMHDLRRSLEPPQVCTVDQRKPVGRPDGGFGVGTTELFSNLDATTDAVQVMTSVAPLLFLKPLLDPGRLLATLHPLLISDVRRLGVNNRGALASLESSLLQFFNKPKMLALLRDPALWGRLGPGRIEGKVQALKETFNDFMDQSQHPRTGYWGPWYVIDDQLIKLHDLSYTFHAMRYRKPDEIQHWPQILQTTLEIRALEYPYGWKPSDSLSPLSNHHNMDVVAIFRKGFAAVDVSIRGRVARAVFDMLDWCLRRSLAPTLDAFAPVDEIDSVNRYYFGIMFLEAAGYWAGEPFWWDPRRPRPTDWPKPRPVAQALLAAFDRLNSIGSFADEIREVLGRVIATPMPPRLPYDARACVEDTRLTASLGMAPSQSATP